MLETGNNKIRENLLFALGLSILALIVYGATFLAEVVATGRETGNLQSLSGGDVQGRPISIGDKDFSRIYRIRAKGKDLVGTVLTIKSRSGTALVAALFATDGELEAATLLGDNSSRIPWAAPDWFTDFLGKGNGTPFPGYRDRSRKSTAVSGATESFTDSGDVLRRISEEVRSLSKEGK